MVLFSGRVYTGGRVRRYRYEYGSRPRSKALGILVGLAVFALLVGGGVVFFLRAQGSPEETAASYLAAWQRGDYAAMRALVVSPPSDFAKPYQQMRDDLKVTKARFSAGETRDEGDGARVGFTATLSLRDLGDWTYDGELHLVKRDRHWRVDWSPAAIHPALRAGQKLERVRGWPDRAPILGADGTRLDTPDASGSVKQLVGEVGPATAEDLKRLGSPYRSGDDVGHGGLEQAFERQLAGTPSGTIRIVGDDGEPVRTIARLGGKHGTALRTTLDLDVQQAAADAIRDQSKPTAMVAVRPSTGEVLAVANKPGGFNRALLGRYPPGSTFKVITASALVADGVTLDQSVGCPPTTTIGGRSFHNYKHENFGTVSFRTAFAKSCNTSFANLATERLSPDRLAEVAGSFGFGSPLTPGVPAERGQFPVPKDETEMAVASFGQGRVLATPLLMATVAAAIDDGTWRPPELVTGEAAKTAAKQAADAAATEDAKGSDPPQAEPRKLDPKVVDALRKLMPAVVSEGTASGVDFPPGVAGKTGTAEFGPGENPPTHAWFIGYRDDVAFAVVVEGGGTGAEAAAPLAADFLRGL